MVTNYSTYRTISNIFVFGQNQELWLEFPFPITTTFRMRKELDKTALQKKTFIANRQWKS